MSAIDTDANVTDILGDIIAEGYNAVGRYYSSNPKKRLTSSEAVAISWAGLRTFVVFEDSAKPVLDFDSGVHDAQIALQQARAIRQPQASAIYFSLDSELGNQDLTAVREYFRGISEVIGRTYELGIYGDGLVCKMLLDDRTCQYAWLSASRGYPGSKAFYKSRRWALAQDPNIDQDFHGVSIDLNEVNGDFGSFAVDATRAAVGVEAQTRHPDSEMTVRGLQPSFRRVPMADRRISDGAPHGRCVPYFNRSDPGIVQQGRASAIRWTVPDLCKAYDWPTNLLGGGVIGLVELDGGWTQADMAAFFNSISQPAPLITDISVDGTRNTPNQHIGEERDPDIEVALDIQVAGAAYYAATNKPAVIRIYWAANSDPGAIAAAVRKATADGCDVCSISWGSDEANWAAWGQQSGRDFSGDMEAAAQAATQAGMIVLAASGDNNSSDGGPEPANVDVPSSCPHVIGCGGTSKSPTSEMVWNNNPGQTNGDGTGGGYSTIFPPQPSQVGAPYPPQYLLGGDAPGQGRMVPDISANADPNTGYWMFVHGHQIPMGGTSAVAPLYAGLFAALGKKLGFVTPTLWEHRTSFNDITQGENGGYRALLGPDPCTGLGSPVGTKLATLFATPASTTVTPASPSLPAPGWSGTVSFTYVNGVLSGATAVAAGGGTFILPQARLAVTTVTVHQGHRYSATVSLTGFEQLASNAVVEDRLTQIGFRDVSVTGSGGTRQAQGVWTGADSTVQLDSHLSNVTDLGAVDALHAT